MGTGIAENSRPPEKYKLYTQNDSKYCLDPLGLVAL